MRSPKFNTLWGRRAVAEQLQQRAAVCWIQILNAADTQQLNALRDDEPRPAGGLLRAPQRLVAADVEAEAHVTLVEGRARAFALPTPRRRVLNAHAI